MWNLRERALASTIDDQEGYRLDNAVVGISEEESVGYLALAFSNGRISVFIISDDVGHANIGVLRAEDGTETPEVSTPALDALAMAGVRLRASGVGDLTCQARL